MEAGPLGRRRLDRSRQHRQEDPNGQAKTQEMTPRAPGASGASGAIVAILAAFATSCGAHLMKLPSGQGVPVSPQDAAAALAQATATCRAVRSLTAERAVSGSSGGRRPR